MSLTEARQALADALSTLDDVNVRLRQMKTPRALDGWTVSGAVVPDGYGDAQAQIGAVILLSPDPIKADEAFDGLALGIVEATKAVDGGYDIRVDPATVNVEDGTPWNVIAVSISVEVQP
jgi:hypothetical protein